MDSSLWAPKGQPGDTANAGFLKGVEIPSDLSPSLVHFVAKTEAGNSGDQTQFKAYPDGSQYSIGFGTRAKSADEVLDRSAAAQRLFEELRMHQNVVQQAAKIYGHELTPNQINALTSFSYNVGAGNLNKVLSTSADYGGIAKQMLDYNQADLRDGRGKVPVQGLANRRAYEWNMFHGLGEDADPQGGTVEPKTPVVPSTAEYGKAQTAKPAPAAPDWKNIANDFMPPKAPEMQFPQQGGGGGNSVLSALASGGNPIEKLAQGMGVGGLMNLMAPKGHTFEPVEYDPFKAMNVATGKSIS